MDINLILEYQNQTTMKLDIDIFMDMNLILEYQTTILLDILILLNNIKHLLWDNGTLFIDEYQNDVYHWNIW